MKTWQKYLFIYIPIGIFCCLINFCAKKDSKTPYAEYHLFNDFEKNEYSAKDLYTGTTIGEFIFSNDNEQSFFDLHAEEISGSFMIGSRENYYQYPKIELNKIKIEKIKRKNLDFYTGKVGDWHSVVIMSLDNHDYHDFYKSQNRRRYLFFLLKNGDYNFSTKDSSVYNLYSAFCASIKDMKYAAILE